MANKFSFSMWNYPTLDDAVPNDPETWAECGLAVSMAHTLEYGSTHLSI